MGRDATGIRIDKKPNAGKVNSNGISNNRIRVSPELLGLSGKAKDDETEGHITADTLVEECLVKQDVLGVKSTNCDAGLPEGKTLNYEVQKSSDKKLRLPVKGNDPTKDTDLHPPTLAIEKKVSTETHPIGAETVVGGNCSTNANDFHSLKAAKQSQANPPQVSRKSLQSDNRKHVDEDDNWSVASSAATSVRTAKFKTTVPVGPVFRCVGRLEKRKEFYTKLGEKHQALKAEKMEYEARTKEEEDAAIKQLRKTMMYKANPVPSFYQEGPPPKVELKKLPLTRAKSPNLTRRKSCGDAAYSTSEGKGICTKIRHSLGSHKDGSITASSRKNKEQISRRNGDATCKIKDPSKTARETTKTTPRKMAEQRSADITVNG